MLLFSSHLFLIDYSSRNTGDITVIARFSPCYYYGGLRNSTRLIAPFSSSHRNRPCLVGLRRTWPHASVACSNRAAPKCARINVILMRSSGTGSARYNRLSHQGDESENGVKSRKCRLASRNSSYCHFSSIPKMSKLYLFVHLFVYPSNLVVISESDVRDNFQTVRMGFFAPQSANTDGTFRRWNPAHNF